MNLELFPNKAFYLKYILGQLGIKNSNLKIILRNITVCQLSQT